MSTDVSPGGLDTSANGFVGKLSKWANDHVVLVMLGPPLAIITAIFLYPVLWMFYQSLFFTAPGLPEPIFKPLYNYTRLFSAPEFWLYLKQTLIYSFGSLILSFTAGLGVALAANQVVSKRLRSTYSTIILFSWALPLAVVALTWKWIFVSQPYGLLNMLLMDFGLTDGPISLLANKELALPLVTFVDAWLRMPFAMVVFLAGLQSIPQHMYDAAKVDGATTLQRFWNITVPYLRPYMAIVGLISWMFAFRAFAIIYPMTQGGPGVRTTTLAVYIYREGMIKLDFGYGSAIAVFLVAITVLLAIFYVTVVLERIEE
ncbi:MULTISPECIES: carbohydrate ABC transporter permease [unclassified Haladaptatus]|uniref:carbohydrate ABC transporter permease n=1 Tax=unclassified Haladaptatus TaxID=2622732 RepID=UPI0023E776C5|nr:MULTISPECIES: sugar ABC transporter permease [unclassified Haladaptatus]